MDARVGMRRVAPGTPERSYPAIDGPGAWVPAGPARAHLWYIAQATGVPWPALAVHAHVSVELARHLLFGRLGRPVRRIAPVAERRLLALSVAEVLGLRHHLVPADPTVRRIALLRRSGWDSSDFSAHVGPTSASCTELTALLVLAECLQGPWPLAAISGAGEVDETSWDWAVGA